MKTDIKKVDKLKRVMTIEIDADGFTKDKQEIYKKCAKDLKVPGFRPGNAPLDILEKHHGKFLKDEFLKRMIPAYYEKALEANDLRAAALLNVTDVVMDAHRLSFAVEFEVQPQVAIEEADYKNIKVKVKEINVEEIEIEKIITQLKDSVKKVTNKDYADEALAKWAGYPKLGALREAIRAQIYIDKLTRRRSEIENATAETLLKNVKIDVPAALVAEQHSKLIEQELYGLRMKGLKEEDLEKYREDIDKKIRPIAEKQIKLFYILEAIASKETLAVGERNVFEVVMGYVLSCAQYS